MLSRLKLRFIFVYVEKRDAAAYKSFVLKILGYSRCISNRINYLEGPHLLRLPVIDFHHRRPRSGVLQILIRLSLVA